MALKSLSKSYEPQDVEARWSAHWEEQKTFTPDPDTPGDAYSVVIPPPNVTGKLHIGHALNHTLQDILCRHRRQLGDNVLWVPGMDHAGIATQNVVERALKAEGLTREDLGRKEFIDRVWQWKEEYGGAILGQIRRMGQSVDWERERFTMDEGLSKAVREVFVRLYNEDLIYRGNYIINWCNRCHTALADDEVEHEQRKDFLYQIRYPLTDGSGDLVVATSRPETMLGDTAVAVHPEDERYNQHIGKYLALPLTDRKIIVIGDSHVDREFGTGCLKVTPAHDMNDWEIGRTHDLEVLQVIDEHGNMNELAGKYAGISKEDARKQIVADLKEQGFLVAKEDLEHNVGACYRCKSTIEPHVSTQWFVAVKPLAEKARKAVETGETKIYPETWTKTYYNWLDNIRDWCISRQIWWGHRIPAWLCDSCDEIIVAVEEPEHTCSKCGGALIQEEDVLDTWFSSALWPFSTLGWPEQTKDLERYYPTSVLVTAFDILFFWVARMMMMGIHFQEQVPFKHVYIHALVRDAEGKKMSKSTGNVIDPLDMIDKYGTDALRFTLTAFAAMGRDIKLSEDRIEGYRNFVNKLWNAARFALMNLPESVPDVPVESAKGIHHKWMLHRLEEMKDTVKKSAEDYRFNDFAQTQYAFVWHEFCDWYLEMIKGDLNGDDEAVKASAQKCLWTVLSEMLVLLHPVMPFVTREIWECLPDKGSELALEPYPEERPQCRQEGVVQRMELLQEVITGVRNIRAELNIGPSVKLALLVKPSGDEDAAFLKDNEDFILKLARLESMNVDAGVEAPKASAGAVAGGNQLFVPLSGIVDFDAEIARLEKELTKVDKELSVVSRKLANEDFTAKAPPQVVEKEREKERVAGEKRSKMTELLARMKEAAGK
jgi:valyl-tRNA synthetase